ncbi:BadF/BadG/BcrA/BcrD ATPase family protein [Actinoplanes friuliensis]|uniref:BadF/BadG/BcrA/BcrD ATPase family protein n=1 Tax=Actinoplanes friuliensis TaxID=196914 RepID=UPI000A074D24|nr:BadF/BadG/BcrA/BcrD ATPase family protein [Actinoplanes friuliensis]
MMLVLGVDAGGTASRAVLSTSDGTVVGRGSAGPGNPTSAGPEAVKAIGTAVREALGDRDPAAVRFGVVGVAGAGILADSAIAAAFAREWADQGLTCPVTVVGDAVTAFAAGTSSPSGAVLIAGTGAVAARIDNWQIGRTADGLGWLLGDEGSGVWLGLQAVRAVVRSWPVVLDLAEVVGRSGRGLVAAGLGEGPTSMKLGLPMADGGVAVGTAAHGPDPTSLKSGPPNADQELASRAAANGLGQSPTSLKSGPPNPDQELAATTAANGPGQSPTSLKSGPPNPDQELAATTAANGPGQSPTSLKSGPPNPDQELAGKIAAHGLGGDPTSRKLGRPDADQDLAAAQRLHQDPISLKLGLHNAGEKLAAKIAAHAGIDSRDALVQWAGRQQPSAFAALAPLICAAAIAGDPLATRLTTEAAARLVATLGDLGPPDGPVVLAGSLLTRDTPVRAAVLAALPAPVSTSHDPALGAAWLALRHVTSAEEADNLHRRML